MKPRKNRTGKLRGVGEQEEEEGEGREGGEKKKKKRKRGRQTETEKQNNPFHTLTKLNSTKSLNGFCFSPCF